MIRVVLNNRKFPMGRLTAEQWVSILAQVDPPIIFLNDLVDPLIIPWFGDLLRGIVGKSFILHTSLAGFPGFRALKGNIAGDKAFTRNCIRIHAYHIPPTCSGFLSTRQFLERAKHLVGYYPLRLYLSGVVEPHVIPPSIRRWFQVDGDRVVKVKQWQPWAITTSGRYKDDQVCEGQHTVVGPTGFLHPCVIAAAASFGRGVYRGKRLVEGDTVHGGREKCSLRGCVNNERHTEDFGSYRFVHPFTDSAS